jgi:hypothetical protein
LFFYENKGVVRVCKLIIRCESRLLIKELQDFIKKHEGASEPLSSIIAVVDELKVAILKSAVKEPEVSKLKANNSQGFSQQS